MRTFALRAAVVVALASVALIPAQSAFAFTDVPQSYWDYTAIQYVAATHTWMQDYGTQTFKPSVLDTRSFLARTLVKTFAPNETIDPKIHFSDLADNDPFYRYANVSVKLHWISRLPGAIWNGGGAFNKGMFDQALVTALKIPDAVKGLANIHMDDGDHYHVWIRWPYLALAAFLRLHYNHSDESLDLQTGTLMKRDEVAYSLYTAYTLPSWQLQSTAKFNTISLPALDENDTGQATQEALTQYGLNQVGFPYIWGGEWNAVSPQGYCCGYQPQGGFDCSGYAWWVLKKAEDGYDAAQFRSYPGWSIHDRSSSTMAEHAPTHVAFGSLKIGFLMFFASNGGKTWQDVDHVGIYIGNGWMMHSTTDGPQLGWVADGWYHDHFVWGRQLFSQGGPDRPPTAGGDPPITPTSA